MIVKKKRTPHQPIWLGAGRVKLQKEVQIYASLRYGIIRVDFPNGSHRWMALSDWNDWFGTQVFEPIDFMRSNPGPVTRNWSEFNPQKGEV